MPANSNDDDEAPTVGKKSSASTATAEKPRLKKRVGDNSISDSCISKLISTATSGRKSPQVIIRVRQLINDQLLKLLETVVEIRGSQKHTIEVAHVQEAIRVCGLPEVDLNTI
jgi:hypothetical protein